MDLHASTNFLLMPQMGVQPVPVQLPEPLPPGSVGLLLGRGSLTLQGLIVHPGLLITSTLPKYKSYVLALVESFPSVKETG